MPELTDDQPTQPWRGRQNPPPIAPSFAFPLAVVFFANVDESAIHYFAQLGAGYTAALSADKGVWQPDLATVDQLVQNGGGAVAWADCRPAGEGTPAQAAIDLAKELELDGWIGQAETQPELQNSVGIAPDGALVAPQGSERARIIVGNPNAWTQPQRDTATLMIHAGDLTVLAEVYKPDPGYSAQGVPVARAVYGVAMDAGLRYPLADYFAVMPAALNRGCGAWHAAGLLEEDWRLLGSF